MGRASLKQGAILGTWRVVIDTPDFEQSLYVEEPEESTEDTVRKRYSRIFTVLEVEKVADEDD